MRPTLYIDSGSTLVKWGLSAGAEGWGDRGACLPEDSASLGRAAKLASSAVVANVAGERRLGLIRAQLGPLRAVPVVVAGEALGVRNLYSDPAELGVDRWCAVLAAYRKMGACLVLTAGTAVTLNWVDGQGRFRGGAILPGMRLMRDALAGATRLDVHRDADGAMPALGTAAAIAGGIRLAIVGAAGEFGRECGIAAGDLPTAVCGGGAQELVRWLPGARLEPDLVLEGMRLLHPPG